MTRDLEPSVGSRIQFGNGRGGPDPGVTSLPAVLRVLQLLCHGVVMTLSSWPAGTVVMLATQGDGPSVIPVSAALRAPDGPVFLALAASRGSLARLRADPRVALLVLAARDIAATIYGQASVVDEALVAGVVAVRIDVHRIAHHERPSFVIDSAVGWHWTDETAEVRDGEVRAALARLTH